MKWGRLSALVFVALAYACSSSSNEGTGTGNSSGNDTGSKGSNASSGGSGSVGSGGSSAGGSGGVPTLTVNDQIAGTGTAALTTGGTGYITLVGLSSATGLCSALSADANTNFASATTFFIAVVGTSAIGPGTYDIYPSTAAMPTLPAAIGGYNVTTSSCASAATASGTSGTITIASVTSSTVAGTYDVTFPDGTMQGSFSAPICSGLNVDALIGGAADAGASTCTQ